MKKKLIYSLCVILFIISGTRIGTYAYFSDKKCSYESIATGEYPKPTIKIYASCGPVFKGALPNHKGDESLSYQQWLTNASKYISKNLTKQTVYLIGSGYNEFKNIANGNSVSVNNDIGSSEFKSWKGKVITDNKCSEHGTIVHYLVAISKPIKTGLNYQKIKLVNQSIDIRQYDVFKSVKKDKEYCVQRDSKSINIANNCTRVRTFDFKKGKYIKTGTDGNPKKESDLMIFDVGGKGYYSLALKSTITKCNQEYLDDLKDELMGKKPHGKIFCSKLETSWVGKMKDIVMKQMVLNDDVYCKLDRTECSITFKYKDYIVPKKKYIVKFNNSIIRKRNISNIKQQSKSKKTEDKKECTE